MFGTCGHYPLPSVPESPHIPRMSTDAEKIEAELAKAQSTSVDGVSTTRRSMADYIQGKKFQRELERQDNGAVGPVFSQFVAPGGAK